MEVKSDVVIISAFGRGHWVAQDLARAGMSVAVVDVTESIGKWSIEDWEGPFGYFETSQFNPTQLSCLTENAEIENVSNGVTIWLPGGPVETLGPLAQYHLQKQGLDSGCEAYLHQKDSDPGERHELERLKTLPFSETWICQLAHQLAANVFQGNAVAMFHGAPLDIFSPWKLRRPKSIGSWETLEKAGIKVFVEAQLLDVGLNGRVMDAVEIKSKLSGLLRGDHFVWTLSSEDSTRFTANVRTKLFPWGHVEPEWTWTRYRVEIAKVQSMQPLPDKLIMIQNLHWPWTHTNFCILQRTREDRQFDVWIRIPNQLRFQLSYLERMGNEIIAFLDRRVPGAKTKLLQWPADYHFDYRDLGASRFPVFSQSSLEQFRQARLKNFYCCGPEVCDNLGWSAQFRRQATVSQDIQTIWRRQQEKLRRRASEVSP